MPQDEQNKRLNSARFQLDVMAVPGLIVARTDSEAATFLDGNGDERDQSFILGATNLDLPSCKTATLAILRRLNALGAEEVQGHELYDISEAAYHRADVWLDGAGVYGRLESAYGKMAANGGMAIEAVLDETMASFLDAWQSEAGLKTYPQAVAEVIAFREEEGAVFELSVEEWLEFAPTPCRSKRRRPGRARWASTWSGTRRLPGRPRATTRFRAASSTPFPVPCTRRPTPT